MASSLLLRFAFLPLLLLLLLRPSSARGAGTEEAAALTLDASNFTEVVAAHQFIVIDFYAPWCYWSKKLAPEYDKAASILRNHVPPIVLAKIDADDEKNKDLAMKYRVQGYPTIKVLANRGYTTQNYYGERDAESIVQYLKKQVTAASTETETKSAEDAASSITNNNDKGEATDGTLEPYRMPRGGSTHGASFELKFASAKILSWIRHCVCLLPVQEVSDQPVKKVSANNQNNFVFDSAKKVLLEMRERMKWACHILVATIIEIFK